MIRFAARAQLSCKIGLPRVCGGQSCLSRQRGILGSARSYASMSGQEKKRAVLDDPFGVEGQSKLYSQYRPRYPPFYFDAIMGYCSPQRDLYIDMCTGSGQVLTQVHSNFKRTIGIDRSEAQLSHAPVFEGVSYVKGDATDINIPDHTVDLLTIGQAMHWLNVEEFLAEVKRVLKPTGTVAIMGYAPCEIKINEQTDQAFKRFYHTLDQYWDCDRRWLDSLYEGFDFTHYGFQPGERTETRMVVHLPIEGLRGYLRSWSSYNTYVATHKDEGKKDIIETLIEELQEILGGASSLDVTFPYFLLLSHPER